MGKAIQLLSGHATNPSTTFTAITMESGDSLTIRDFSQGSKAIICGGWSESAAGGQFRIHSPRMHDNVQGIRLQVPAADSVQVLPQLTQQVLYPNDPLTVEITGGAAETDTMALLVYYEDLPGVDAVLGTADEVLPQVQHLCGVEVDLTGSGTAGAYSAAVALNANFSQLKADQRYAILGYTCLTSGTSLGITGPDTGNMRMGGPLSTRTDVTASWFVDLSRKLNRPCIPIIKANNAANTNIDCTDTALSTARKVSFLLGLLAS